MPYKTLFLIFMLYPMWRAGTLAGSPAEEMTRAFLWTPVALIAVPLGVCAPDLCAAETNAG